MTLPAELIERARAIPIEGVAAQSGVKLRRVGRELIGACPQCGGVDRFGVNVAKGVWRCRGCNPRGGDVIALQQHIAGSDFGDAVRALAGEAPMTIKPRQAPATKPDNGDDCGRQRARKAAWLWGHRQTRAGSIAERYLRQARGYEPKHVTAIHLTLLKPDGSGKVDMERPKLIIGSPLGKPIVLSPPYDLLGMAVSEGVKDGLSAFAATGLGVWIAGAAGFMPALADAVPSYIDCITIYSHPDPAGQRGAHELAERLVTRNIEVFLEGAP